MKIKSFKMERERAYKLWKQYVKACRENPHDKFLQDMKKVYNQLKSGRKLIDITTVFKRSGIRRRSFEPRMAIALASTKTVFCEYRENGTVRFLNQNRHRNWDDWSAKIHDVIVRDIFPELPKEHWAEEYHHYKRLQAPVPMIPASIRPKGNLGRYYILWEVEKWERIPPRDPYLLRRVTKNMFVVVAGWKLTELEMAVMKGRVY